MARRTDLAAISAALGLRPGEGRRTALLFAHLLLASSIFILGRTVRDTLFLSRYSLSALPWMFVAYGVASSVAALVYGAVADRFPRHRSLAVTLALGSVAYVLTWGLVRARVGWILPVFYVLSEVLGNLFIVQFWTLANDLHDPRAARRLFPVIGSARVLGVVLIGVTSGAIVRAVGTAQLLFVLAALALGIVRIVFALRADAPPTDLSTARPGRAPSPLSDPYVRALSLFILLTFASLTVGDYQFKVLARQRYQEDTLAQFFALFYAATGIASFLFQVFATPRILARFGVGWGVAVMPSVFGAASAALTVAPSLAFGAALKFADLGFQYTIHDTSLQALYVPFAAHLRARTRAILDAAVKPLAYGAGGVVLALVAPRLPVQRLSWVTLALVAAWLGVIPLVRRRYVRALQGTLSARGGIPLGVEGVLDAAGRETLTSVIARGSDREALAAIETLPLADDAALVLALESRIERGDARTRAAALDHLAGARDVRAEVIARCLEDASCEVRAAACRCIAACLRDEAVDLLRARLVDAERAVRVAAAVGLLQHGGVEGDIVGGAHLATLLSSESAQDRADAATVLGALGREAYRPVRKLLGDGSPVVRRAAVHACAGVADPRLVDDLVAALWDPSVRAAAVTALSAIGAPAARALLARLADESVERAVRLEIPRALRNASDRGVYEALKRLATVRDSHLRLRVLTTLSRLRATLRLPPEPLPAVHAMIVSEVVHEYRVLAAWDRALPRWRTALLEEELAFRWTRAVRRVLRILELRHSPRPLELVRARLADPKHRANALEVLDSMLDPTLRPLVMLFVDNAPVASRAEAAGELVPALPSAEALVREEAAHPNPYVARLALDALTRHDDPLARELAAPLLEHREKLVREGARIALGMKLEGDVYSTLEKIVFLKRTDIFGAAAGEDLAGLADAAETDSYAAGEAVFREGEVGDRLYVLVRGRVRVTRQGAELATLSAGEAFGEMAVLDASVRSATVTAVEETEVLSIRSEDFYESLHEQVEIAEGVIKMLVRRLRDVQSGAPGRVPGE